MTCSTTRPGSTVTGSTARRGARALPSPVASALPGRCSTRETTRSRRIARHGPRTLQHIAQPVDVCAVAPADGDAGPGVRPPMPSTSRRRSASARPPTGLDRLGGALPRAGGALIRRTPPATRWPGRRRPHHSPARGGCREVDAEARRLGARRTRLSASSFLPVHPRGEQGAGRWVQTHAADHGWRTWPLGSTRRTARPMSPRCFHG